MVNTAYSVDGACFEFDVAMVKDNASFCYCTFWTSQDGPRTFDLLRKVSIEIQKEIWG